MNRKQAKLIAAEHIRLLLTSEAMGNSIDQWDETIGLSEDEVILLYQYRNKLCSQLCDKLPLEKP